MSYKVLCSVILISFLITNKVKTIGDASSILQRPFLKTLTSLAIVTLILGILVAASNAFIDRGRPEVGKSLKAFIRHPVICLCVTGNGLGSRCQEVHPQL